MSVGGHIIDMTPYRLRDGTDTIRIWVCDPTYGDETIVFAEPFAPDDGPKLGEVVWWQAGRIFFDGDKRHLRKIGSSSPPIWSAP
jgi:hypothetical protein